MLKNITSCEGNLPIWNISLVDLFHENFRNLKAPESCRICNLQDACRIRSEHILSGKTKESEWDIAGLIRLQTLHTNRKVVRIGE